jgi:hypothetical protein
MSNISTIRSSAKKDRTNVPQPEEILSHRGTLGDSAVADGNRQNDIRLRAYEIYVQANKNRVVQDLRAGVSGARVARLTHIVATSIVGRYESRSSTS